MKVKHDPFVAVRIGEFRNLMLGRFIFIMALRMMSTMVGWWVYELTHDPFAIGLIGLSEVVPAVSMALYAGHVIDMSEKKRMLITGVSLYFCCATLLTFLSGGFFRSHLTNHQVTLVVYAIIFCTGVIRSFTGPVFNVLLAHIVPRENIQNATSWSQGTWLTASVTGHAMGGFLIATLGNHGTLFTLSCLIAASLFFFTQLSIRQPLTKAGEKPTWESVKEGLRFVFKTKEVLGALTLDLFAVFFGGAVAMVPVYARDILKVGPMGFGWLNAASDIGSICIVILLTLLPFRHRQGKKLLFAVAGFGACIIIFGISQWFLLSFAALMIAGMLDGISVVIRGTILQLKTPMHLRGRVMSVNSMFINSSNELGQFESGLAARIMGVKPSVVFGGCMTILVVVFTWFKDPQLKKLEY
jgi:MFS family permease